MRRHAVPALLFSLTLLILGLLGVAPGTLRIGFPVLTFLAAALLLRQSRSAYVQFCCWLWVLSPMVRRLVDWRTEFIPTNPLLLAPCFAAVVGGVVVLRHPRELTRGAGVVFAAAFAGIAFGTVVGLVRFSPAEVLRDLVSWLPAPLFGFFLYVHRRQYLELRRVLARTLIFATLVTSVYGIAQFFLLPPWDEAWMLGLRNYAFGQPFARELRVFSTMNSPPNLAFFLVGGILVALAMLVGASDRGLRIFAPASGLERLLAAAAVPCGVLALALTSSRALWLALVLGVIYLAAVLPGRARVRVAAAIMLAILLAAAATALPGVHDTVVKRLQTLTSGTSDVSAHARIEGHVSALTNLAAEPLGEGMGATDTTHVTDGTDDRLGPHDSTLLEFLYSLGGPGTFIYALGLGAAVWIIYFRHQSGTAVGRADASEEDASQTALPAFTVRSDPFAFALRAALFGLFAQCLLTSILFAVDGFFTWIFIAMALCAATMTPVLTELAPAPTPQQESLTTA